MTRSVGATETAFCRDPEVLHALASVVVPALAAGSAPGVPLRAWSIDCARGPEAWSLAALLATRLPRERTIELLGTDPDPVALEVARAATYEASALERVPHHLGVREWFESLPGTGQVRARAALRERVRFAVHDLVGEGLVPRDVSPGWFDLVACRGVLGRLEPALRQKARGRLATILRPGGALVLGQAEGGLLAADRHFQPFPRLLKGICIWARVD